MRFLGRALSGIVLLAMTLALLAWAGVTVRDAAEERMGRENRARPARERVFAVNVIPAEPKTVTPELAAFGEVKSRRTLEVRATAGGTVVEVAEGFEDGGRVSAGDLLFRVDPAEARSRVGRVMADKADAEAEARDAARSLELARDELAAAEAQVGLRIQALERQEGLKTRGVGTEAAVENAALALSSAEATVLSRRQALANAESRVDNAAASLERLKIDIDDAERALGDTRVFAEFDGILSGTSVVRGGVVNAGERVATLIDGTNLEVAFRVSTSQYARLLDQAGRLILAPVTVSLDVLGVDLEYRGRITRESAEVGEGLTGRLLFASLDGAQGLRSGDFVTVRVEEPEVRFAVRVPATAVSADGAVLVVGPEDRLEELSVQVLRRQGDEVLVRSRELAGRDIVAERSPLIGTGIRVRPLRPGAADEVPEAPTAIALSDERRARLVAAIEDNQRMPAEVKERILGQLQQPEVPAQMVERLEERMGISTPDEGEEAPRPAPAVAQDNGNGDGDTVELSDERRAALIAFVEGNTRMPDEVKTRILGQLREPQVPAALVERLEDRMGG